MNRADHPAIELNQLVKTFRPQRGSHDSEVRAVDSIDLVVEPGEVVAFLGPNGAGKTTTLDMVLGLSEPTSGTARVFGRGPRESVVAGRVSAVLQSGGLLRGLSMRETVRMIASTYAVHSPVDDVIERAGLSGLANRRVSKASGGEQQRLRFALALLPDPRLLILDEPTAGMDAGARREFWETMHAETSSGRTVIFATHYLEEAQSYAPRTILIVKGRIRADRPTDEMRAMVGERVVTATLPEAGRDAALARLGAIPDIRDVRLEGERVRVEGSRSDEVAL